MALDETWRIPIMAVEASEPLLLSALQHWCYCPRQWALIHLEQVFEDNLFTQRGQALHKRVDDPGFEIRNGLRVERALPLFCDRLGLIGKADVVEFLPDGTPYPVEYKQGSRHKRADIAACDDLQLAAQAICLEEMFDRNVPEGALYYASSRRRRLVAIDASLRQRLEAVIAQVRDAQTRGATPQALNDGHCRNCSLKDLCQPEISVQETRRQQMLDQLFNPED
ncbi:MAG: CRISPR-associated protein Cas4 [Azoarcus sp.]|jgi:CRISPR-associated exonuclease Cas4|nr:CRISPR-associated protein Cas4 [Azoarcus sp.]